MNKEINKLTKILSKYLSDIPYSEERASHLFDELSELFQEDKWISVEKELPIDMTRDSLQYLRQVDTASQTPLSNTERYSPTKRGVFDVRCTHWQPLPKPPKEK